MHWNLASKGRSRDVEPCDILRTLTTLEVYQVPDYSPGDCVPAHTSNADRASVDAQLQATVAVPTSSMQLAWFESLRLELEKRGCKLPWPSTYSVYSVQSHSGTWPCVFF